MNSSDAHKILKLNVGCTREEIKVAFRNLSLQHHPDKGKQLNSNPEEFLKIKNAYNFLKKLNINKSECSRVKQQPTLEYELELTLEEFFSGCTKQQKIHRRVFDEFGVIKIVEEKILNVEIRPGMFSGTRITINKEGDIYHDKIPANVVFILAEKPHSIFKRARNDLKYTANITSEDALFGCKLRIPTLDSGDKTIPLILAARNVNSNTIKRILNHGFPIPDKPNMRGDLLVCFNIQLNPFLKTNLFSSVQNENSYKPDLQAKINLRKPNQRQIPPKILDLYLTSEELFNGCVTFQEVPIEITNANGIKRKEIKIFEIKIPKGTVTGEKIIFPRKGDKTFGTNPVDVIFCVVDKRH